MKRYLKRLVAGILLTAMCGVTITAAETFTATPKISQEKVIMTIPKVYSQVYDKLAEFDKNNRRDDYYFDGAIPEPVVEEVAMESAPAPVPIPRAKNTLTADMAVAAEAPAAVPQSGGGDDYSKTNTQVDGIDEGDIVKTDGKNIYIIRESSELIILSASGKDTKALSRTKLINNLEEKLDKGINNTYGKKEGYDYYYSSFNQYARELYINGNTLAVILTNNTWLDYSRNGAYTYKSHNYVSADLYDISDPAHPKKTVSLGQEGNYEQSRLKDGKLYLTSNFGVNSGYAKEDVDSYIPHLYKDGEKSVLPVGNLLYPAELESKNYIVMAVYDLEKGEISASKGFLGRRCDTLYMSNDNIYVANSNYYNDVVNEYKKSVYDVKEYVSGYRTEILKFACDDKITIKAVGRVNGELLNQFSLDEYKGNLRAVTTEWSNKYTTYTDSEMGFVNTVYGENEGTTNALHVLDANLNPLGSIVGLAKDERVYSVRFTGDVGYFVTFRQVDPLFAVNLSDPSAPKIMSQLKIPGFSNYLHPYSSTLLFGLGQDADEKTGWTKGMKLSMFDTSDPYNVFESAKLNIGDYYSEALYNHKAILVSPDKGIIGFPASGGYAIYGYTPEKGFREISDIKMDNVYWSSNTRGLYVGNNMYIVFDNATFVLDMTTYTISATVKY